MSIPTSTLIAETLELMRLLDHVDEVADCLIWNAATSDTGHPIYKKYGHGSTLVRREIYRLNGGELFPRKPIDTRCNEKCCVNPDHLFQSTISRIAKKAAARGAWKSVVRSKKISESKRASSKLTIEQAREIRVSDESGPVLALRYGVDKSLINRVKAGKAWTDYANPYASLMASNEKMKVRA